jgi:hypothetical protein
MALFGIIGGLAAIAGPVLGGLLIEANLFGLGWRCSSLSTCRWAIGAVIAGLRFLRGAFGPAGGV